MNSLWDTVLFVFIIDSQKLGVHKDNTRYAPGFLVLVPSTTPRKGSGWHLYPITEFWVVCVMLTDGASGVTRHWADRTAGGDGRQGGGTAGTGWEGRRAGREGGEEGGQGGKGRRGGREGGGDRGTGREGGTAGRAGGWGTQANVGSIYL